MALKTVTINGVQHKFGRLAPPSTRRTFTPQHLLTTYIPWPMPSIHINPLCLNGLSKVFKNDTLGCCVISQHAHSKANASSIIGKPFIYTDAQVIHDYSKVGGYIPGKPNTDQGCNVPTDLAYLKNTGFADGTKISGWINVDPTNPTALKRCICLFGELCFGICLPDKWVQNMDSLKNGFVWDVAGAAVPDNGHCFNGFAYPNNVGIAICTWGIIGTITWKAIAKYGVASAEGEVHSYYDPDIFHTPNGVAWTGYTKAQADVYMAAMGQVH